MEWAWTTSWGVSTRMIGGVIMAQDNDGLILPPKIASTQIVLVPLFKEDSEKHIF